MYKPYETRILLTFRWRRISTCQQ